MTGFLESFQNFGSGGLEGVPNSYLFNIGLSLLADNQSPDRNPFRAVLQGIQGTQQNRAGYEAGQDRLAAREAAAARAQQAKELAARIGGGQLSPAAGAAASAAAGAGVAQPAAGPIGLGAFGPPPQQGGVPALSGSALAPIAPPQQQAQRTDPILDTAMFLLEGNPTQQVAGSKIIQQYYADQREQAANQAYRDRIQADESISPELRSTLTHLDRDKGMDLFARVRHPKGPTTSINNVLNTANSKFHGKASELAGIRFDEGQAKISTANATIGQADRLDALNERAAAGAAGPLALQAQKALEAVGLDPGLTDTAASEEYQAIVGVMAGDILRSNPGPQTDADATRVEAQIPNLSASREGRAALTEALRRQAQYDIDTGEYIRELNPRDAEEFRAAERAAIERFGRAPNFADSLDRAAKRIGLGGEGNLETRAEKALPGIDMKFVRDAARKTGVPEEEIIRRMEAAGAR